MEETVDKFLSNDWEEFEDKLDDLEECNDTLDSSKAILKNMGYSDNEIGEICQWFELNGGYCDCEVVMNVVMRERENWRR
jgi:hypothetical protein